MEAAQQPILNKGKKPSVLGILTSPKEQFQRMNQNPTFWGPLIIFTILGTILVVAQAYLTVNDPAFIQESMEQFKGQSGPAPDPEFLKLTTLVISIFIGFFTVPVVTLVGALVCWVMVIIFQGETTFRKMFSLNVHLSILSILSMVLTIVYAFITGNAMETIAPTSLAAVVSAEGALKGILASVEVFVIWSVFLTAMGLSVVGELSKGKAWTISLILYGIGVLLSVVGAVFNNMMM